MAIQKNKSKLTPLIALIVMALGGYAQMNALAEAGERIEITREIVLQDKKPIHELAINQVPNNDGYVITGSIGAEQAWALRLDKEGQQKWSYTAPRDVLPENQKVSSSWHGSHIQSATVLKDGSTLLCGYKNVGEEMKAILVGLLTRIDINGNLINQQLIYPQNNQDFKLNYIHQCAQWNDGYVVFGTTTHYRPNEPGKSPPYLGASFYWILKLDAHGEIQWEKLVPTAYNNPSRNPALIMADGDLVMSSTAGFPNGKGTGLDYFTDVLRLTSDGEIKATHRLSGTMRLVRQPNPAYAIRLVPFHFNDSGMQLITLKDDLSEAEHLEIGKKEEFGIRQAIELSNHSIVLVGETDFTNSTAAMIRFSPDLSKRQDYIYQPRNQSWQVEDGLWTDSEDEWVTIRTNHDKSGTKFSHVFSFAHAVSP